MSDLRDERHPEARRQYVTRDPPVPARWDACTPVGRSEGSQISLSHAPRRRHPRIFDFVPHILRVVRMFCALLAIVVTVSNNEVL
jgi:hypothetical protein